jgi:hypothetical protein
MRLDQNVNPNKLGKYALIKLRETGENILCSPDRKEATIPVSAIDFGNAPDSDFFVIRLKDKYAAPALKAYANAASADGEIEFATDVMALANQSRRMETKKPD